MAYFDTLATLLVYYWQIVEKGNVHSQNVSPKKETHSENLKMSYMN